MPSKITRNDATGTKLNDETNPVAGADPSVHPAGETKPTTDVTTAVAADEYVTVAAGAALPPPATTLPDARLFAGSAAQDPETYSDDTITKLVDDAGHFAPLMVRMLAPILETSRVDLCLKWLQDESHWPLLTYLNPAANPAIAMAHTIARLNADLKIMTTNKWDWKIIDKYRFGKDIQIILGRLDLNINAVTNIMARLSQLDASGTYYTYLSQVDFTKKDNMKWLVKFWLFGNFEDSMKIITGPIQRLMGSHPEVADIFLDVINQELKLGVVAAHLLARLSPFVSDLLKIKPDLANSVLKLVEFALKFPNRSKEQNESIVTTLVALCIRDRLLFKKIIPIIIKNDFLWQSGAVEKGLAKEMSPSSFFQMLLQILKSPSREMEDSMDHLVHYLVAAAHAAVDKDWRLGTLLTQVIDLLKETKSEKFFKNILYELDRNAIPSDVIKQPLLEMLANITRGDDPKKDQKTYQILCALTHLIETDKDVSSAWVNYLKNPTTDMDEVSVSALLALCASPHVPLATKVAIVDDGLDDLFLNQGLPQLLDVLKQGAPTLREELVSRFDNLRRDDRRKGVARALLPFFAANFDPEEEPIRKHFLFELEAGRASDEMKRALEQHKNHPQIVNDWKLHVLKSTPKKNWPAQVEQLFAEGAVDPDLATELGALFAKNGFHDMPLVLMDYLKTFLIREDTPAGIVLNHMVTVGAQSHPSAEMRLSLREIQAAQAKLTTTDSPISADAEEIAPNAEIIESPETGGGGGSGNLSITDGFDVLPALGVGTFVGLPVTSVFAQPAIF